MKAHVSTMLTESDLSIPLQLRHFKTKSRMQADKHGVSGVFRLAKYRDRFGSIWKRKDRKPLRVYSAAIQNFLICGEASPGSRQMLFGELRARAAQLL